MVLDSGTVYADTITAMAVFTGVAVALLLYLVSQQTASFWYIARVYFRQQKPSKSNIELLAQKPVDLRS